MKDRLYFPLTVSFACLLLFGSLVLTGEAVYEGTANANMMIRRYERKGQFGKAALWRETAVECLDVISIPLAEIIIEYCERTGNQALKKLEQKNSDSPSANTRMEMARKMKAEIADTRARQDEHLRLAELNREKANESKKELDAERGKIDKFIAEWVPHYPDRFYEFGTYRNIFGEPIDELKDQGRFAEALLLEADASDMCARQYEDVTIRYFRNRVKDAEKINDGVMIEESQRQLEAYQEVRDKHLRRSAMLRALAMQKPQSWPAVADKKEFDAPKSRYKLTVDKAIRLAREDRRIQQILGGREDVREYAWFQGFCWTVSYYSHSWGCLAIAFVDDDTGKVTDVLTSPGDLEERERYREDDGEEENERDQKLRLSSEKVIEIGKRHPKVKSYFEKHPKARASAAYNWRYNCWVVEVILGDREVGVFTVSDRTEEVLEVALEQDKE